MKSEWVYLSHMRDCIELIEQYISDQKNPMQVPIIRDAVLRNLQLTGQSSLLLSDELKSRHPRVKWVELRGLRNLIVHDYFEIDYDKLEQTVMDNLPLLKQAVLDELAKFPPEGPFKARKNRGSS